MKSITKRAKTFIVIGLCALLAMMVCFVPVKVIKPKAETIPEYELDLELCKEYTSSDTLYGNFHESFTVEKYMDALQQQDASLGKAEYITAVIPEETLVNAGSYYYMGSAYSFWVNTSRYVTSGSLDPANKTFKGKTHIALIDNEYGWEEDTAELRIGAKLYNLAFDTEFVNNKISKITYSNLSAYKYYLHDLQFGFAIQNEHALNVGDVGYEKETDPGTVIRQTRLNYSGLYFYDSRAGVDEAVQATAWAFVEGVASLCPLGDAISLLSTVVELGEAWENAYKVESARIEKNNEPNIVTEKRKEAQKNDTQQENYVKDVVSRPQDSGLMIDDYAEMIVMLSDNAYKSRISYLISYNIVAQGENSAFVINQNIDVRPEDTLEGMNNKFITSFEDTLYEDTQQAEEGANPGYLLDETSEQTFSFTPKKNGDYKITAGGNELIVLTNSTDNAGTFSKKVERRYLVGETQYIRVKRGDGNNHSYILNIEFIPTNISTNVLTEIKVGGKQTEYFRFTPTITGLVSLNFQENPNLTLRIGKTTDGSHIDLITCSSDTEVFLRANNQYDFIFSNYGEKDYSGNLTISNGESLEPSDKGKNVQIALCKKYVFNPTYNGNYTLQLNSQKYFQLSIYDKDFQKIYSSDVSASLEYNKYFKETETYYVEIYVLGGNGNVNLQLMFSPKEVGVGSTIVTDIDDYNIVEFVPNITGKYLFTAQNTEIQVYDSNGVDKTTVTLLKGQKYYAVLRGSERAVDLEITLNCDRLQNNIFYTVKSGINTVAFIAPESGIYQLEGIILFTVENANGNKVFDNNSKRINLIKNNTYYIGFDSSNANASIKIYFDPADLSLYTNTVLNNPKYYEISNYPTGEYTFVAQALLNKEVKLVLFDGQFNTITNVQGEYNSLKTNLSSGGKYYLYVEIYNVDTMLYVVSANRLKNSAIIFNEGANVNKKMAANQGLTFKFIYNKNVSQTQYLLKINETLGEQIDVSIYYVDTSNKTHNIELVSNGRVGQYFCDLKRSIGTYYITIQSAYEKQLEFDLYVPAVIEGVEINNHNIASLVNRLYLGLGNVYDFNLIVNSDATYPEIKLRVVTGNTGITCAGNRLTVPNNTSLLNRNVEIAIETADGNDYKMYIFQVRRPYYATMTIQADTAIIECYDLFGDKVDDLVVSSIDYSYTYENGSQKYILENSSIDLAVDLTYIPNYDDIRIQAIVRFDGGWTQAPIEEIYNVELHNLSENVNFTNQKRVVYNAVNESETPNQTLRIPNNIRNVVVIGDSNKLYSSLNIIVESRSIPLTMNFYDFRFKSKNSSDPAIKVIGNSSVYLNIYGACRIETENLQRDAISCYNLNIVGKVWKKEGNLTVNPTLYIKAGSAKSAYNTHNVAGRGIYAGGRVEIESLTADIYGGSTNSVYSSGYYGAHGGNAIECTTFTARTNAKVKLYGGDGGFGQNGSTGYNGTAGADGTNAYGTLAGAHGHNGGIGGNGGTGGEGGNGGYALLASTASITSNCSVELYGGNGGDGGRGGNGGKGGNGGNGAPTSSREGYNDGGRGGNAGRGGNGGNGGKFGFGGKAYSGLTLTNAVLKDGYAGTGGAGGNGGVGGNGGNGGADTMLAGCEGPGGNGGNGGNGGSGYFNIPGYAGSGGARGIRGSEGGNGDNVSDGQPGSAGSQGGIISFNVNLKEGEQIKIKLYFTTSTNKSIYTIKTSGDPYLELYNYNNTQLTYNDDGNGNLNARLSYSFSSYSTYYLVIRCFNNSSGAFSVNMS